MKRQKYIILSLIMMAVGGIFFDSCAKQQANATEQATQPGANQDEDDPIARIDQQEFSDYDFYIQRGESVDTTVTLKRDSILDFKGILQRIYNIQTSGKMMDNPQKHPFAWKFNVKSWPGFSKDFSNLEIAPGNGTIFIEETIYKSSDYYLLYSTDGRTVNGVAIIPSKQQNDSIYRPTSYILNHDISNRYYRNITTWQKNNLLQSGRHIAPPNGIKPSRPFSKCTSRVTLTPDSVRIDMIKYYKTSYAFDDTAGYF